MVFIQILRKIISHRNIDTFLFHNFQTVFRLDRNFFRGIGIPLAVPFLGISLRKFSRKLQQLINHKIANGYEQSLQTYNSSTLVIRSRMIEAIFERRTFFISFVFEELENFKKVKLIFYSSEVGLFNVSLFFHMPQTSPLRRVYILPELPFILLLVSLLRHQSGQVEARR